MRHAAKATWALSGFFGSLVLVVLVALGSGCVKGVETDQVGSHQEDLAAPITISLSAPSTLSPLAPVVGVSNSTFIGASANIVSGTLTAMGSAGGGVHAEPDALLNDTWSRGTADLRDRVKIRGTLHAANRNLGNSVVITASDTTPPFDPPSTLTWNVSYPSSTPGPNVTLYSGQSQTLTPGQYGSIWLSSGATLTLGAGTYFLTSLDLESASVVKLDQAKGPVIIYVMNVLILRGTFVSLAGGSPDLLIGYLGTTPFLVETLFDGAIIAPSTTVTLRAVTGTHTGFFYAKDFQILDAHAQVQYRAPLPIITASNPTGATCQALVAALVPPSGQQSARLRYCKNCASPADTDRDGVQDCIDGCPYDPLKTQPGLCGCGTPETDTDGDKVPDCIDPCPLDPNNTSLGQCGCVGQPGLKPAGTPCFDTACPQSGATCNGSGVCGNRAVCLPATGCRQVNWDETSYAFCGFAFPGSDAGTGAPATQANAQAACTSKGLTLTRIDSLWENQFIRQFLTSPLWLGANDISVSNTWRWSASGTNNGDQFWSGGTSGSPVGSRFAFWEPGAPGANRCAAMLPTDGRWVDVSCNESLGYICEFRVPIVHTDGGGLPPPPGMPAAPAPRTSCIPEVEAGLPDSYAALQAQVDAAYHDVFQGAAANPPAANSICPETDASQGIGITNDSGAGCAFVTTPTSELADCIKDTDCSQFGPGFICRQTKNDTNCSPIDASAPVEGGTCKGRAKCGTLVCPTSITRCNQVEICGSIPDYDAGLDPGSTLGGQPFTPASLFNGPMPDAAPTGAYSDPPLGVGPMHAWCSLGPQDPASVKPVAEPNKNYSGSSGSGSKIKIDFNPDLIFDADPTPLALGETNVHMHAQAKLATSVALNDFLGQSFKTPIIEASIGMRVDRCSANSKDDTKFTVFGLDLLPLSSLGVPEIDTSDPSIDATLASASAACEQAVGTFQHYADRAKKSFRDAQQLLAQYHAAKAFGGLSGNLCEQIHVVAADVPFFPGGNNCPLHETTEQTINRFIDYYQAPGYGQINQLRQASGAMTNATSALKNLLLNPQRLSLAFKDTTEEESQTIVNVPFAIGPIPMVLQVDIFADYGVTGSFDVGLSLPISIETTPPVAPNPPNSVEIARVQANVLPHASAGLSAFVGAGVDLGPIAATVGIEGAVTLARISAPIFAGVSLNEEVAADIRPIPAEFSPPVSVAADLTGIPQVHFGVPKSFKFAVRYSYGAALELDDVLSGEINGRLRIKFFFFSRTWRKRIVKFNGWSEHFNLISGGSDPSVALSMNTIPSSSDTGSASANVASGAATMGRSEQGLPLTILARLPLDAFSLANDAGVGEAGSGTLGFDASAVQGFFYDDLCCVKGGEICGPGPAGKPPCCPGFDCMMGPFVDGGVNLNIGSCVARCKDLSQKCSSASDCCVPDGGIPDGGGAIVCGSQNTCVQCGAQNAVCGSDADCCSGFACNSDNYCDVIVIIPNPPK